MDILPVFSVESGLAVQSRKNVNTVIISANSNTGNQALPALGTNTGLNAANTLASRLKQNTSTAFVPDVAETVQTQLGIAGANGFVPALPVTEAIISLPANIAGDGAAIAAGPIAQPVQSIGNDIDPNAIQSVIPPIAAYNIMGGESTVVIPAPKQDAGDLGGSGEVMPVLSPQPALNNVPGKQDQGAFTNSEIPTRRPSAANVRRTT